MTLQVPAFLIDSAALHATLDRLHAALRRPPSIKFLDPALLSTNQERVTASVHQVSEAAKHSNPEVVQALVALSQPMLDPEHEMRLARLVGELTVLWPVRVTMALGIKRSQVLRDFLVEPGADLLAVLRREEDENAHSDVLRWCFDIREAPNLAPALLRALVSRFPRDTEAWRAAVDHATDLGFIRARREVVIGHDLGQGVNKDRIDLVISGPGFVIGLENKVLASEHHGQTRSYARWLASFKRVPLRAGVFLTPSGIPAASRRFLPLSYLELVTCLLEAAITKRLTPAEHQVLAGYLKTLHRRVLRREFNAILTLGGTK
jgi:hypothetical protein